MKPLIQARDVVVRRGATGLSLDVEAGQLVAIVGPAGSGKTRMLHALCGIEKPERGQVLIDSEPALASEPQSRRSKPSALAGPGRGAGQAARTAEALHAIGLWHVRSTAISSLSPGQVAACSLLPALGSDSRILAIDGQLDLLDPWRLLTTMDLLAQRRREGAAAILVTNRPDVARAGDTIVALTDGMVAFVGTPGDLIESRGSQQLEVEANDQDGVRALVEPFEVELRGGEGGSVRLTAKPGQALAARLLAQGYGNVRLVVSRQTTFEEALNDLLKPL